MVESRGSSDVSVIGRGARVEGSMTSSGALRIHGHMKGELSVEGEISVFAHSVVEADVKAGSISLGGRVKGNLIAPGAVSLPPHSQVQGDVQAHSVLIHGVVEGDVRADDKVELGPEARVHGDITCRLLVVAEGAMFRGRSIMDERSRETV
jgi:cytoskeletal protein CcmA (bactofilin family)